MKNELIFALVTGASSGLGKNYAIELAKRGNNVLLIAKKNEGLPQLSEFIKKTYNVASFYFETDMYIETGAYFNFQENVVNGVNWAFDLYFSSDTINVEIDENIILVFAPITDEFIFALLDST